MVLANSTVAMSGSYACVVHFWYNRTCCDNIANLSNDTVQKECSELIANVTGTFSVNVTGKLFALDLITDSILHLRSSWRA